MAIRIVGGEVTSRQLRIVRQADAIFIQEIVDAGLYREISQAFAALLPVRAVGVMGDKRVYEQVISLRAVVTTDFMTAGLSSLRGRTNLTDILVDSYEFEHSFKKRVSSRIVNEVEGVCRVVEESRYPDISNISDELLISTVTSKPPATIEME